MLRALITNLKGSEVLRGAAVLASGTAIAQAVTIAAMPITTRIFSPEQYGILGVIVSIAMPLAILGTLRYDQALLIERNGNGPSHLFVVVLVLSAVLSLATCAVGTALAQAFGRDAATDLYDFLPWTGLMVFAMAMQMVLSMWAVHLRRYKSIAVADVLLVLTMVTIQLAAGLLGMGAAALVGGQIVGTTIAIAVLGALAYRSGAFATLADFDLPAKVALACKHFRFPLYATPTAILERFSKKLPIFLLAFFFSPVEAGYYWLCYRLLVYPVRLIVQNSRKPYYKRALDLDAAGQSLAPLLWKSTGALGAFTIPMAVTVVLLAPDLFQLLFGEQWERAGHYAQWLAIATTASVLSMPCLELAPIYQRQGQVLAFQIVQAIVRALAIIVGGFLGDDLLAVALFAIGNCAMNVAIIGYFWRLITASSSQPGTTPTPSSFAPQ